MEIFYNKLDIQLFLLFHLSKWRIKELKFFLVDQFCKLGCKTTGITLKIREMEKGWKNIQL